MKNTIRLFTLLSALLFFIATCTDNNKEEDNNVITYNITQKRISLYSSIKDVPTSELSYMFKDPNKDEYYISLSGYSNYGLFGKVHNLPKEITDLSKVDKFTFSFTLDGEAIESTNGYSRVPEIKSIEFYCKSIKDIIIH